MSKVTAKLKEELEAMIPPTIFFFVTLHLIAIIRSLMLRGTGIAVGTSLSVTIAALVLGKSVLIADALPLINRYPDKPLMYNVLWKTAIYTVVALIIHYLEHLIDFWREAGSFVAGNHALIAKIIWPHFWAIQILLVVMIFWYCTLRELVRVIGRQRALEIIFGDPAKSKRGEAAE